MAKSGPKNTLQQQIMEMMREQGTKNALWTPQDIMDQMGLDARPVENALYNAWKTGKIYRHKEKSADNYFRYALYMKEQYRENYVPQPKGSSPGGARKKKKLPTAKELRVLFASTMNQMAQLEDSMLAVVERQEQLEKTITKIESLID